ncbi:unnamed protein product [Eruca vesicaria subsp. sativa]|uniref:Peptidase C1A papain C-terminal domain-containing protein n=1 Tax=Eruca vesicaria subsp. sativa TaxID=29727 RepID=A0ABC8L4C5_ERUVS|nr:unnamed protein product [Eruca vesicaria subsp. sativa]
MKIWEMDSDSDSVDTGGVGSGAGGIGGVAGDGGIGGVGARGSGKDKGPNLRRLEAEANRKSRQDLAQQNNVPQPPPLRVFSDGSRLLFDWCLIHPLLLSHIICQIEEICWAIVLGRILQFAYNKDNDNINQYKELDIDGFAKKVKLKENEKAHKKASESSMAVGSLKNAMKHVREVGIEKKKDTERTKSKTFTVRGSFLPVKDATPEFIVRLMQTKGPVGMTLDMTLDLMILKMVPKPVDGLKRHVVIIVAHGLTLSGEVFFDVQNTWGTDWGDNGHGRIIITGKLMIYFI